jgi:hypothetical protein
MTETTRAGSTPEKWLRSEGFEQVHETFRIRVKGHP